MGMLKADGNPANGRRGKMMKGQDSPCHKVIKMAMEHDLVPVIVFSFSKKDCELYALQMSKLDFNTGKNLFVFPDSHRKYLHCLLYTLCS